MGKLICQHDESFDGTIFKLLLLVNSIIILLVYCNSAFALQFNSLYVQDSSNNLYTVNSTNGIATFVGVIGIDEVSDIAFNGSRLYGITFTQFLEIDPKTGQGTVIGSHGYEELNSLAISENGSLFSASNLTGNFVKINPVNGVAQLIGNYGVGISSSGDLIFSNDGILYATVRRTGYSTDWLAEINPITGSAILIGDIGYSTVFGLSFIGENLYGGTESGELLKIDTIDGSAVLIGTNSLSQWGMSTSPILSPVDNSFDFVTRDNNCIIVYNQGKWCFNQHKTGVHRPSAGICNSDDTYSWDINLNTPVFDFDYSKPVYSVAPGVVTQTFAGCTNAGGGTQGQVLIQHNDGEWWSGYLHLNNIQVSPGDPVSEDSIIGNISNVGTNNNHLHFVLYTGNNVNGGLNSFDTKNILIRDGDDNFCSSSSTQTNFDNGLSKLCKPKSSIAPIIYMLLLDDEVIQ